ncbi:hypothetical protein MPSEU_000994700 [Mayamaea pseudoterrestris]|nr:hypothetical protein MPSEU_000994700 [Mayamaea pseudoterrestris]
MNSSNSANETTNDTPAKEFGRCRSFRDKPVVSAGLLLLIVALVAIVVTLPIVLPRDTSGTSKDLSSTSSQSEAGFDSTQAPSPLRASAAPVPPSASIADLTDSPTESPIEIVSTSSPTLAATAAATSSTSVTYRPGIISPSAENQLYLAEGLSSKVIANSGQPVQYPTIGGTSDETCHSSLDFGATFADPNNDGGWIYVSNSEDSPGGVGAFTFSANGDVIDYRMLLTESTQNCGGGKTPWNAWITCEEKKNGRCYQVDPTGQREAQIITVGEETDGGMFESFAYWIKDESAPQFFITEDVAYNTVRRFIPDSPDWSDPWSILLGQGETMFLLVNPSDKTFTWTSDVETARENAQENFPGTEGLDQYNDLLYIISKNRKVMLVLDLINGTYTEVYTQVGRFNGQPDQITRFKTSTADDTIFFAEDEDTNCGVFGRNVDGTYAVLTTVSRDDDSVTGLAFSPDGKHMYIGIQNAGILYDITRDDGLSFESEPSNVIYE